DGSAAFADSEPQTLLHRHRRMQLDLQRDVVARHHHLRTLRKLGRARHIRCPEAELRTIAVEERRMTAALFLRQHVDLALELGVRRDRARLRQHHPALHIFLRDTAQQKSRIVARTALIQLLLEHLDARHHGLACLAEAHDLRLFAYLHLTTLDTARHYRAGARDGEDG